MNTHFKRQHLYAGILTATTLLSCNLASANDLAIEEIVVTAQKRSQSLQDVGIAVTAFSGDQIKEMGLSQPIDLAAQTPGVDIKNALGNANPIITIRGVGLNDYHSNNNPSTAAHIDEVYLGSSALLSFQMFDIERVEILKGPQGTLYGRNSTAGTVNFISNKPSQEFDAYVDASYGNYNALNIEAAVGGGLTENLSGRFALMSQQSDGYQENKGTAGFEGYTPAGSTGIPALPASSGDDGVNETDVLAWRTSLLWNASDKVDVLLSMHGNRDKSGGFLYSIEGGDFDGFDPASLYVDTDGDPYTGYDNSTPSMDSDAFGTQLRVDWDTDFGTLTSISAYESVDRKVVDGDGHPLRLLEWDWQDDIEQITQEVRLSSNDDSDFQWIVGAFYSDDEIDFSKLGYAADWLWTDLKTQYVQTGESYALFTHTEWQFAEALKLTFGLRYTDEEKEYKGSTADLDPYGDTFFISGGGLFTDEHRKYSEDDVSGKIGLDWTPNDDVLIYGSISKGFKSGGFDGSTAFSPTDITPFTSETLWSYEAGFKTTLADGSVQLNGAVFYYDYQDMQAEATVIVGGFVPSSIRTNAGNVEMTGAEMDIWWRPAAGLDLKAGFSLLDSEVVDWNSSDPAEAALFEGNEAPDAPELTFNGLIRYEWDLVSGMTMTAMTDFNYNDSTFKEIENNPDFQTDDYWLVNARLSLTSADESWTLGLWGKNLADEEYVTNAASTLGGRPGSRFAWYGAPRTYGVSLRYNWQ